jgi:succinate dehydrogenase / fumarate reductase membrane anchor subunit
VQTPLKRVLGLGAARSGTEHFWLQRLTAVANLFLITIFVLFMLVISGRPRGEVLAILSSPLTAIFLIAVLVSVLTHMRIGMQVIIEDYIHGDLLKVVLLMLNTFFVLGVGIAGGFAALKLGFGG